MPYNIIKEGNKYELRLVKNNKLLGTHKTKKEAVEQIQAIEINKTGRLNPELYEKAKKIADQKYGLEHSARKQQQITRIYKSLGGEYTKDLKPNQESLKKWTLEDWGTKSGKASKETGERYLPKYIIDNLTQEEYDKTTKAKQKGKTQYVKQPKEIIEKIRKIKEQINKPFKKVKIGNHIYTYYLSDKPSKKLMTIVNGKKIYFGSTLYKNYKDQTSLLDPAFQHFDEKRRKNYIARASKIRDKEGNLTYLNPESANFHAIHILW